MLHTCRYTDISAKSFVRVFGVDISFAWRSWLVRVVRLEKEKRIVGAIVLGYLERDNARVPIDVTAGERSNSRFARRLRYCRFAPRRRREQPDQPRV